MGGVVNWVGETDKFCFQLYGLNGPQSKWKLLEEVLLKDLGEILENINDWIKLLVFIKTEGIITYFKSHL